MAYPYLQDLVQAATGWRVPLPIPTFGLSVLGAVAASLFFAKREFRRLYEIGRIGPATRRVKKDGRYSEIALPPQDIVVDFGLITVLAGIVGARVFSIAEFPREFIADPWPLIFSRQGFNFFGGLVFGVLCGMLYLRRHGLPVLLSCDAFAPSMMLGYALGRVGCQISGDGDWGIAANLALKPHWLPTWAWAQTYENNIAGTPLAPPGVYPTPIYEILMGLALFGLLWALRKHPFRPGWLFSLYLLLCGGERFGIEWIRVNATMNFFGLQATQAQIIAVFLMLLGTAGLVLSTHRRVR